jgi:hypothetical protein
MIRQYMRGASMVVAQQNAEARRKKRAARRESPMLRYDEARHNGGVAATGVI